MDEERVYLVVCQNPECRKEYEVPEAEMQASAMILKTAGPKPTNVYLYCPACGVGFITEWEPPDDHH